MGKNETDKVSRALTMARERGRIPWSWIVEDARTIKGWNVWQNPSEYADAVMASYARDWWADQPERVIVVSEKGTVGGMVQPVLAAYRAEFLVLKGFGSATSVKKLAVASESDDRPLTIIYIGDHDPSGRYMSDVDLPERLERYGGTAALVRVAVLPEQVKNHAFRFSAHDKAKDARYRWFVDAHGEDCYELDTLNPNTLRDLVEGAIVDRLDWSRWNTAQAEEVGERAAIRENLKTLKEMQWL
jgi:hypothetical protein